MTPKEFYAIKTFADVQKWQDKFNDLLNKKMTMLANIKDYQKIIFLTEKICFIQDISCITTFNNYIS